MAFSKAKFFDPLLYHQSSWSKALAHPARIIILTHLQENGITPFHVLKKKIPLAATTISQHLRILRTNGLIEAEEKFPYTYYKINRTTCEYLAIKLTDLQYEFIQQA